MLRRWAKATSVLFLLLILLLALFRHQLCRYLIAQAAWRGMGLTLTIKELNLDILNSSLSMEAVTVNRAKKLHLLPLARVKSIFIKYNLIDALRGRIHLYQLKADIDELNLIKQAPASLPSQDWGEQKSGAAFCAEGAGKKRARPPLLIEKLELYIKKATLFDFPGKEKESGVIVFMSERPFHFEKVSDLHWVIDALRKEIPLKIKKDGR